MNPLRVYACVYNDGSHPTSGVGTLDLILLPFRFCVYSQGDNFVSVAVVRMSSINEILYFV